MSATPFPSQTQYHHSTACHCSCHHTQPTQAQQQHSQPSQSNAPAQTELSHFFNGIQEYFRSLYTPPQLRVTRSGFWSSQSMAFGRQSLSNLSYDEAETLFRSIFESEDDQVKVPLGSTSTISTSKTGEKGNIRVIPSIMEIHATFLREPRGSTDASVLLHRSAWPEVIENVKGLSVVFRKGKVDESRKS